jgi:hypothetical protein
MERVVHTTRVLQEGFGAIAEDLAGTDTPLTHHMVLSVGDAEGHLVFNGVTTFRGVARWARLPISVCDEACEPQDGLPWARHGTRASGSYVVNRAGASATHVQWGREGVSTYNFRRDDAPWEVVVMAEGPASDPVRRVYALAQFLRVAFGAQYQPGIRMASLITCEPQVLGKSP